MILEIEGCVPNMTGAEQIEAKLQELKTIPDLKVVDRVVGEEKCPYCGSVSLNTTLWDFTPNKPTFDDVWVCGERTCGKPFIMRTKRNE